MISHRFRFIFVHNPKTAGSAIRETIRKIDPEAAEECMPHIHMTAWEHKLAYPNEFDEYYKFGFVRNPWDLIVSHYFYHRDAIKVPVPSINDYLHGNLSLNEKMFVYPCKSFFTTQEGENIMDDIFRYEDLHKSWLGIVKRLNLPISVKKLLVENATKHNHYSTYYKDQEAVENVRKFFAWTIDKFGYKFEPTYNVDKYRTKVQSILKQRR